MIKKEYKDMMMYAASIMGSMVAGFVIGTIKATLCNNNCKCVIEEL